MSKIIKKLDSLPDEAIFSKLFYILLVAAFCYLLLFFSFSDIRRISHVIADDAAYFFKMAENVTAGSGLTFDGINVTNGFQPLWLYVLIPVSYIYHGTPEVMCRIYLILQLVFLTLSALILHSIHSKFFPRSIGLISMIFFFFFVFFPSANGMESALLVLMLTILFAFGWKGKIFNQHNIGREFIFGVVLGLVMLSRLDMVFLGVAISAFCFFKIVIEPLERRDNLIRLLMILAGSSLIVSPYLIYNYFNFGSIMPISGILKSSFPSISFSRPALLWWDVYSWPGVLLALSYLLWFIIKIKKLDRYQSNRQYFQVSMAIMSATVLLHCLHTLFFIRWGVFYWHFIPYAFFISLVISEPIFYFLSGNQMKRYRTLYFLGIVTLIIFGSLKVYGRHYRALDRDFRVAAYNAAIWAKKNTKETEVFVMENAGVFSYFSQRSVINLDGVMNNLEYQDVLRNQQFKNYLRKNGVQYYVKNSFSNNDVNSGDYKTFSIRILSRKYMVNSDEILLKKANEVYRSPYIDVTNRTAFIIWKLSYH